MESLGIVTYQSPQVGMGESLQTQASRMLDHAIDYLWDNLIIYKDAEGDTSSLGHLNTLISARAINIMIALRSDVYFDGVWSYYIDPFEKLSEY